MLEFSLHEVSLGPRFYILLPKLNSRQLLTLGGRLRKKGFAVHVGPFIVARSARALLRVNPSGLCWSTTDPSDLIVPAIPEMLTASKKKVSLDGLKGRYFALEVSGSIASVQMRPRMEGGSLWRGLRGTGQCALAPDEATVLDFLLKHTSGQCNLVTDFPSTVSLRRVINDRQYFESRLSASSAHSTLASVERQEARNSFLPQRGLMRLTSFTRPSRREYLELFEGLGQWCYFRAT